MLGILFDNKITYTQSSLYFLFKIIFRCARYLDLPPQCRLVSDFREPCCQKPVCDLKGLTTSATGTGPTPTPAPDLPPTLAPSKRKITIIHLLLP